MYITSAARLTFDIAYNINKLKIERTEDCITIADQ